jgi:hypothetical protein
MAAARLRVGVVLSGTDAPEGWRSGIAKALRLDGHDVGFVQGAADPQTPGIGLIALLESLICGEPDRVSTIPPEVSGGEFDLVVSGGDRAPSSARSRLELRCEGAPFAVGMSQALLDMRGPVVEIYHGDRSDHGPRLVASARVALEEPHRWLRSRARVEGRVVDLVRGVVRRIAQDGRAPTAASFEAPSAPPTTPRALDFMLRAMRESASRRLQRMVKQDARWRVCWRATSGDEVSERAAWPAFSYREIPDDGRRFFADPFVFAHEGQTFLFCEEYPFATQRGLISVVEVRDGRLVGPPRTILDPGCHASYPMVFARDGAVWMIPETHNAGRIELWRAERVPDVWRFAGTLVDGVSASDATLHEFGGRLWLLASVSENGSSSWDNLHAWSAERLEGPWAPHPLNPLLIDSSCARPAGLPFQRDGRWIRPAQDCRALYGGALAFCAIDRLDEGGFEQTVVARLGPPPGLGASGVHTLNAAAGIEAIDAFKPARADARRWDSDAALSRFGQEIGETSLST